VCNDVLRKCAVGGGVNTINAMTEYGDSRRVCCECSLVSRRINALSEAADHAKPTATEMAGEFIGILQTAPGWIATANDGNRR